MGHHKRRKRSEFLAGYFDEFDADFSKYCVTEFDKRLDYVFKAPEILEKAWRMPWKVSLKGELKPVVCLAEIENMDECIERSSDTCMAILEDQGWFLRNKSFEKKDWRDFK